MNYKITVIIPVYNVEQYVVRCIESVRSQTYKNLEILVIDDGSADHSGSLCDALAIKDERITVIHTSNGGVSKARNKGLELASGDYISFLDGDDYIEDNMYQDLVICLEKGEAPDLISFGFYDETENGTLYSKLVLKADASLTVVPAEQIFHEFFIGKVEPNVWNKIFKHEVIKNNTIRFDESVSYGEDMLFVYSFLRKAKKNFFYNDNFYHYVKRHASITNRGFDSSKYSIFQAFDMLQEMSDGEFSDALPAIYANRAWVTARFIFDLYLAGRKEEIPKLRHWLKIHRSLYIQEQTVLFIRWMCMLMILLPGPACRIWKIYRMYRRKKYKYE